MGTTYYTAVLKTYENATKLFYAIEEMGLTPFFTTALYRNLRGMGYKVSVDEITEEQKEIIGNIRKSIEPLF